MGESRDDSTPQTLGDALAPAGHPLESGTLVANRYRLISPLSSGGMSRVYVGDDQRLGRRVAIKFLDAARFSGRADANVARRRFFREARVVASLVHPNIVGVFDLGESDGVPFIAMQLLDGETLGARIRAGRLPALNEALGTLREICAAVACAHARGILHRDLKPDNVMVSATGTASLLDFGLARVLEQAGESSSGLVVGTPAYLAPEVLHDEPYSVQSDLFSAGVTFFEYLTGRYPFSQSSMFYSIAFEEAPAPSQLRPELPLAVEALLLRMLAKRPRDRYLSFEEVDQDLERIVSRPLDSPNMRSDEGFLAWQSGAERTQLELPYVGREAELLEIDHGLARAGAGSGSAYAVVGDAGMGKSRLTQEVERRARLRQFAIYVGRAAETRGDHPYQPFLSLLRHWAEMHGVRTAEDLGRVTRSSCPRLAGVEGVLGELLALAPAGAHGRDRIWEAFAQFFAGLAGERPALVVMEDVHQADPASLNLLGFLLHELRRLRLVVVFTCRPEAQAASHLVTTLAARGLATPLTLAPLRPAEVEAMVARLVLGGVDSAPLTALLVREAQGSPLFLGELLKLLKADGVLVPLGQGYTLLREPSLSRIPEGMRSVIRQRLRPLAADEREIAEVAAVIGGPFSAEDLQGVVRSDRLTVLRHLQALERHHHLVVAEGRNLWRFAHERIRGLLYEEISTPLRVEYHGLLADRLARHANPADAPRLAGHYDAAGRSEEAARWHRQAGDLARKTAAFEAAALHYQRALELSPENERTPTLLSLADAYIELARLEDCERCLEEARAAATASGERALEVRAWEALGQVAERRGDSARLIECAERGLERLQGHGDANLESALLGLRGLGALLAGDRLGGRASYEQSVAAARQGGESEQLSWALYRLATNCLAGGELDQSARLLDEVERLAAGSDGRGLLARSLQARGWIERDRGRPAAYLERQERALAEAERSTGPNLRAAIRLNTASARIALGDLEGARSELVRALEFARSTTANRLHLTVLVDLVDLYRECGELAEALEATRVAMLLSGAFDPPMWHLFKLNQGALDGELGRVESAVAALEEARKGEGGRHAGGAELYLGFIEMARDAARAASLLRESAQLLVAPGLIVHRGIALAGLARVLAHLGEPTGAAAVLDSLPAAALESLTTMRERDAALAAIARAQHDSTAALQQLDSVVAISRRQGARLQLAEALIARAAVLGEGGQSDAASAALSEAAAYVEATASRLPADLRSTFLSRPAFRAIQDQLGSRSQAR